MVWRSVEKIHIQIVVELKKCCVHVKNVATYVVFVDFGVFVVMEHFFIFIFSWFFTDISR